MNSRILISLLLLGGAVIFNPGLAIAPAPIAAFPLPVLMAQSSSALEGNGRLSVMGEPTSPSVVPQSTELTTLNLYLSLFLNPPLNLPLNP